MRFLLCFSFILSVMACASAPKASAPSMDYVRYMNEPVLCGQPPLIIGHRGASGYTPEHTLNSYKLALDMGADYIEPDLVMTKDGVLIARHENEISETTNVADKFASRKKTKVIDGEEKTGWFTEDLTLAEIKSLRARERLPFRSQAENGKYEVPTFEEILGFVKLQEKKRGRKIGIAPEIKHSAYFVGIQLPMEEKVVRLLKKYDLNRADSKVMIQSFEVDNLKRLNEITDVELVQLYEDTHKPPFDFKAVREYADWIAPHKSTIAVVDDNGVIQNPFVELAHAAGLKVVTYTFRSDENFLAKAYGGDSKREYYLFFNMGIDALFTDFPDHAVNARKEYFEKCKTQTREKL